jgi:hypothetical protein
MQNALLVISNLTLLDGHRSKEAGQSCKIIFFIISLRWRSSQVKSLITNNKFCIVQIATAQSKAIRRRNYGLAEVPPSFQAGWSDCIYIFLSYAHFFAHLAFPCKFLYSWGNSAISELSPDVMSWGGRCLFCSTRHFRTANSTPLFFYQLPPRAIWQTQFEGH